MKLIVLLILPITLLGQYPFMFTNKPITDPEVNSYGRGAQFWNGTRWDNSGAPQIPPGTSESGAKTFYWRYQWCYMETTQDNYTFTIASLGTLGWKSLEYGLKWSADRGALFAFGGVMTAYDGGDGANYDGGVSQYPQYLHNLMQAETTKDWKYNNRDWIPNWNSPSYLSRWRVLNDTIYKFIMNWTYTPSTGPWAGKLVRGKDLLDYVDIRGYGNFGEWHTWPWTSSQPANAICTDSSMKTIIDITRDIFKDQQLVGLIAIFDDNGWSESNAWRAYYMLTSRNDYGLFGWRRDNIGDKGYDNFLIGNTWKYGSWQADTAILNRWKYAMITGEPLNGSGSGNCCPIYYHIRPEIASYHYAGFGNGNYGVNTQAAFDTIRNVFKITGYRYNFTGGSMDDVLYQTFPMKVSLQISNVGSSPIYQKRWKLIYRLKNSNGTTVSTYTSKFNPYLVLPGDTTVTDTFYVGNIPQGSGYQLTFSIEDTVGLLGSMPLVLSSPVRNADNTYTLRTDITVRPLSALPIKEKIDSVRAARIKEVIVYPNPVNSVVTVLVPDYIRRPYEIYLNNLVGQRVITVKGSGKRQDIDLSKIPKGVYFLSMYNNLGGVVHRQKILVQ